MQFGAGGPSVSKQAVALGGFGLLWGTADT